jgi:hypothetical protein
LNRVKKLVEFSAGGGLKCKNGRYLGSNFRLGSSALAASTVVTTVADGLLVLFGALTPIVLLIIAPAAAVTFTTMVPLIRAPTGCRPIVHVTVPVAPCAGAVQVPGLMVTLWNVVPVGNASVIATTDASSGPLFPLAIV